MEPITNVSSALNRMLEHLSDSLSPEAAKSIADLTIDPAILDRIDELAERCNKGLLTDDERAEYRGYVDGADVFDLLKLNARRRLASIGEDS